MKSYDLIKALKEMKIRDVIGVPDSTLKKFIFAMERDSFFHLFQPVNEGAAVGLAAGTYLSTAKPACIYMQNSGLGNAVNPIASLTNHKVYGIPILFIIGWRGAPGTRDEPQHVFQGKITKQLLDLLEIEHTTIDIYTKPQELESIIKKANTVLQENKQFAILVKNGTFDEKEENKVFENSEFPVREEVISHVAKAISKEDIVIATTGKISRELYEQSDIHIGHHRQSFFMIGSMGYASMIALRMAENRATKKVFCLDGDGALLMHMGGLPFIGAQSPHNLVHIVCNNNAYESVGGMKTGVSEVPLYLIAKACGYPLARVAKNLEEFDYYLKEAKESNQLYFLEAMVNLNARITLGRPKETPYKNKLDFMKYHGAD